MNTAHPGILEEIGHRDHEVTAEYRIFGPPGTGKTTSLTRQVHRAVERFGPDSVLLTSFSRAAAAELSGRDLPVSPDRVGTLHSHCWHALGGPEIAEANVDEWNRDHPDLAITPVRKQGRQIEDGLNMVRNSFAAGFQTNKSLELVAESDATRSERPDNKRRHLAGPPAMPMARQYLILAI